MEINNDINFRKMIGEALKGAKPFSFKQIVDFKQEELSKLNEDQILDKIMNVIRPDQLEESYLGSVPDWLVENDLIDFVEIEFIEKSEATFEPRYIISIFPNNKYNDFINSYYEE